jgi:gas vesicle protein
MEKYRLETSPSPKVIVAEVNGDLNIKGQDLNEIIVKTTSSEKVELSKDNDQITIVSPQDCTIYVPHHASVTINNAHRNCSIKSLDGELEINNVGRELILRDVGTTRVNNIGLDLSAKRVRGDLTVINAGRGAIVRDIDGQLVLESVGAHLNIKDTSGSITASVGGHADVYLAPVPWQTYVIQAGGTINCRLMEDASAKVEINSAAQLIQINIPEHSKTIRETTYSLEIGEGGPTITLNAGGPVELRSRSSGWESFGAFSTESAASVEELENLAEIINTQVTSQIDTITNEIDVITDQLLSGHLAGISEEKRRRINDRIRQAQERAQRAGERARQRLEKKMEAARMRQEHFAQTGAPPPPPPRPPAPSSPAQRFVWPVTSSATQEASIETASDEERLMILKMLEEKKITAEEAEQLLAALEGRED